MTPKLNENKRKAMLPNCIAAISHIYDRKTISYQHLLNTADSLHIGLLLVATMRLPAAEEGFGQAGHAGHTLNIVMSVSNNPSVLPPLEICSFPGNRRIALTTMWDDGPSSLSPYGGDSRMAQVLKTNGWKGTFAWNLLSEAIPDTSGILANGMEVASHTATHPLLTLQTADTIFWEFLTSRVFFSVLTQRPVVSYGDAYLAHDPWVDRELAPAGFLAGRNGGLAGSCSIYDLAQRHGLPSFWLMSGGTNAFRARLESLYASAPEGTVQDLWGHVYAPEFNEEMWAQFVQLLEQYRNRPDTWYATWAEVGTQMLLSHAAHLGAPVIGSNTVCYTLQIDPLPRDVSPIPLTLRLRGTIEQLANVSAVTVNGLPMPIRVTNGVLLCDVNPFAKDLQARVITAELGRSSHPTVQQAIRALPIISNLDLEATWSWTETSGVFQVEVSVTNRSTVTLDAVAFEILAASIWEVSTASTIPTTLAPAQGFQTHYSISPKDGENVGGWTAFAGRLDYLSQGTPKTHYLFRDLILPASPAARHKAIGPNCKIAGPILAAAANLDEILTQAAGKWAVLPYDPSDRLTLINLWRSYYPDPENRLSRGLRALRTSIIADTDKHAIMRLPYQQSLMGFRFWLNGMELFESGGSYPFALHSGVNHLIGVCDVVNGIETNYTGRYIALEAAFCQPDGTNPLSGISFTASNTPPVIPVIPDRIVFPGQTLSVLIAATDSESLPGTLIYSLVPPVPDHAAIDARSGLFQWTPEPAQAPSTNSITVRVINNATPPLSTEKSFTVRVVPGLWVALKADAADGKLSLNWLAVPGNAYRVEFKDTLSAQAWAPLGLGLVASSNNINLKFDRAVALQRFFRVVRVNGEIP